MIVRKLYHGATHRWAVTNMKKADGTAAVPTSGLVHLRYVPIGTTVYAEKDIAMAGDATLYAAEWDSSEASADFPAFWNVRISAANKISIPGRTDFDSNDAGLPD